MHLTTVAVVSLVSVLSDALRLPASAHHHGRTRRAPVSMGVFDSLKRAFDDIQLERSASAAHVGLLPRMRQLPSR
tara:strand:+ start:225 stop:449 length:225 start_codon:yes stop_codon:yes gene_type:complete